MLLALTAAGAASISGAAASTSTGPAEATLCTALRAPGGAVSFVYGTVHMDDPRLYALPTGADAAFESAKVVVLEAELDPAALSGAGRYVYYHDDTTLPAVVGQALYEKARAAATRHGLPADAIGRMKPWAVASALAMPLPSGRPVLDQLLQMRALEQGKRVAGLETVEEQLALFDALSRDQQTQMLADAIEHYDTFTELRERLLGAFLAQDLDGVSDLARESLALGSDELRAVFETQLIDARNARMAQRAMPMLVKGDVFLAVGALHLPGPKGLLARFAKAGFTLAPGC